VLENNTEMTERGRPPRLICHNKSTANNMYQLRREKIPAAERRNWRSNHVSQLYNKSMVQLQWGKGGSGLMDANLQGLPWVTRRKGSPKNQRAWLKV